MKKKNKRLPWLWILLVPLCLLLLLRGVEKWFFARYWGQMGEDSFHGLTQPLSAETLPAEAETLTVESEPVPTWEERLGASGGIRTLLLIGVDARDGAAGRSDAMHLVFFHPAKQRLVVASLMRDLYLAFPDGGRDKLCHAYAYGGADLLCRVIENNFPVKVERYIKTDLTGFEVALTAAGGVTLSLTEAEYSYLKQRGREPEPVEEGYHLSPAAALVHARNRTVGNDQERTRRQREILVALLGKLQERSLLEWDEFLCTTLPYVSTNLTEKERQAAVRALPRLALYERRAFHLPLAGKYVSGIVNGMWVMQADLSANVAYLREQVTQ